MSLAALVLVVLAALIHAGWNLMAKRAAPAGSAFVLAYSLVSTIVYGPWVIYELTLGGIAWSWPVVGIILLSGLIHLAYTVSLQRGYLAADLSVVYPVARGTAPMLSSIGAFLILAEPPTLPGLLGLLLVVGGILLIATEGNLAAFRRPGGQAGMRWGLGIGGLIACYTVVDGIGVKTLGLPPVVLDWLSNLVRVVVLGLRAIARPDVFRAAMRGHWWTAIGVGVMSPLAYILVLTALQSGAPLSLVAPMREMSMMVGAILGMLVLRERLSPWRLAGCGVLVAGVVLLSQGG